jgi:hypothetical protein
VTAPCVVFYHTRSLPRGTPEPRGAPGVPRLEYTGPVAIYLPAVAPGARALWAGGAPRDRPGKPHMADLGHLRTTRVGSPVAVSGGRSAALICAVESVWFTSRPRAISSFWEGASHQSLQALNMRIQ